MYGLDLKQPGECYTIYYIYSNVKKASRLRYEYGVISLSTCLCKLVWHQMYFNYAHEGHLSDA